MTLLLEHKHVRQLIAFTLILLCASNTHSVMAASITAGLNNVDNDPTIQTLGFNKNLNQIKAGDELILPLIGRPTLRFRVEDIKPIANGGSTISANTSDGVSLLLSIDGLAAYGNIAGNEHRYTISTDVDLGLILVDQNHPDFPKIDLGNDGLIPPGKNAEKPGIVQMQPAQKAKLEQRLAKTGGRSNIRMLVLYSAEFGSGFSSPITKINQLLSFTNQALQRSGINAEFTLARAQQINFNNSLSTGSTLSQVTNGTGAFSGVATLRNQVRADMVAVLSFTNSPSANGVAWVNGDDPDLAFSSTRLSTRCCDSVFAHELGHNLGSGHERASVNNPGDPCDSFNFTGYSCGHGNAGKGWGTIMSRLNSQAVNHVFSNPSLDCLGDPCGVPSGQTDSADNFASFNMSRLLIENFQPDPVGTPPPTTSQNSDAASLPAVISILLDDNP